MPAGDTLSQTASNPPKQDNNPRCVPPGHCAAALAVGDEQVLRDVRVGTRIRARAGMRGGLGFVTACVRKQRRAMTVRASTPWLLRTPIAATSSTATA